MGILVYEAICWTITAERQTSEMRRKYLEAVLRQDACFFDTNSGTSSTYQVATSISSDADTVQDALGDKMPNIIAKVSTFIFNLAVGFILSWRLAVVVLPLSLLYVLPMIIYGKRMKEAEVEKGKAYGIAGGIAEQAISSIRTLVSYVAEQRTLERFNQALEKSTALGIEQGFLKGVVFGTSGLVYAIWAFQAWVTSVLVTRMGAQGGLVFISGMCTLLGALALLSALPNVRYISEALTAVSRIYEMVERLCPVKSIDEEGIIIENIKGEIEFKDVVFTYASRPDNSVLCDFNLHIRAGQTIGLVGGSGSGKSTVISLLQRFYNPATGMIILDGCDIGKLQLKWYRSQMGLVSQEPILFATSIKENILFGNENASMDLVVSAAKAANAHDFVIKLPNGYDTHVGHFGFQMSGGQKQRIAIARALIREPKILLLDEATSSLDAQSERLVQDALDQASEGRTTIIVAHRLTTLRRTDFIAVLQMGKVVESGNHNQLMQINKGEGGIYARMAQLQKSDSSIEAPLKESSSSFKTMSRVSPSETSKNCSPEHLKIESYYSGSQKLVNDKASKPSQWHLLKMNRPEWRIGLLGCIGAVMFGAVAPVSSYLSGSVIGIYYLQDKELIHSKIRFYCFIYLALAGISAIASILQNYNFAIMGEHMTNRVRGQMLTKILSFEIGWFDEDDNSSASICVRLATEANKVRSLVGDRLSLLFEAFTTVSLSYIIALLVSWRLASLLIAIQPLIISCLYLRNVMMTNMSKKAKRVQTRGSQLASEAVVNHRTIMAFSSQRRMLDLLKIAQEGPRKDSIKQSWISGLCLFFGHLVVTGSLGMTYWYGGKLIVKGLITAKQLFQAFFILANTCKVVSDAGSMTSDLAKGGNAVRSVLEILDRKSKIESDDPDGIKEKRSIKGHVELNNVLFCYPTRPEQIILNELSLRIDAGATIALVGPSGSGKSTVIGLIERFYDPLSGSVEIDGKNIKSYNLRFLRSHIALVSQEPTLFAATVRDNIVYGKENATETEIISAATLANAHDFISSMEDGYETYYGERGIQLSGGQKQRIALARAILKDPAILLLDEATSALDSLSETLVQEALDEMMVGRTCVVVAHRLSTTQNSDFIAVIKNGKVVEQGRYSDLLAKGAGGSYYNLINLQLGNSPNIQNTLVRTRAMHEA